MKMSISRRFILGMIFFFVVIAGLTILSAIHLTNLSRKTENILKENHFSVIYAREMTIELINMNQEILAGSLSDAQPEISSVRNKLTLFEQSLNQEKNNITESGEEQLVSAIEVSWSNYKSMIRPFLEKTSTPFKIIDLQKQFTGLTHQLSLLSQVNEKAIEAKTDEAKIAAKSALTQVSLFGTICFIISLTFTFNFASYFNQRFSQLYNGIKEIAASNYGQRLYFEGEDEFSEISLVFNDMAKKLSDKRPIEAREYEAEFKRQQDESRLNELKNTISQLKLLEEKAKELILDLEKKS